MHKLHSGISSTTVLLSTTNLNGNKVSRHEAPTVPELCARSLTAESPGRGDCVAGPPIVTNRRRLPVGRFAARPPPRATAAGLLVGPVRLRPLYRDSVTARIVD